MQIAPKLVTITSCCRRSHFFTERFIKLLCLIETLFCSKLSFLYYTRLLFLRQYMFGIHNDQVPKAKYQI